MLSPSAVNVSRASNGSTETTSSSYWASARLARLSESGANGLMPRAVRNASNSVFAKRTPGAMAAPTPRVGIPALKGGEDVNTAYRHTHGSDTARYALWVLQVHDQYIEETVSSNVSDIENGSTYAYLRHMTGSLQTVLYCGYVVGSTCDSELTVRLVSFQRR